MLAAPSSSYAAYSPSHGAAYDLHQQQHHHSIERPKLFEMPATSFAMDFAHQQHHYLAHQSSTPQHYQQYDHEPLVMNMPATSAFYAPPPGTPLLHISTDYASSRPSSVRSTPSAKRCSREDLNMKEKKRMFKLNDRINQLKDVLEDAGIQTKKNKQSVLDNTAHYISMLRSNLLIAQQKAERAEKQAEVFRSQVQKKRESPTNEASSVEVALAKRCFQETSTPRLIVSQSLDKLVACNAAFTSQAGQSETELQAKQFKSFLCVDESKLTRLAQRVVKTKSPRSALVEAQTANGAAQVTLILSLVSSESGVENLECSVIPVEDEE